MALLGKDSAEIGVRSGFGLEPALWVSRDRSASGKTLIHSAEGGSGSGIQWVGLNWQSW